jgi:glucose/mannose-6-phosphate isomerase
MNLDDLQTMKALDEFDMLGQIDALPNQLAQAWALGQSLPLPEISGITRILISGMGDPAIGADLLAGYAASFCSLPVNVHRDYGLPAYATGKETLVIAISHSGNTEETLDAFNEAQRRNCTVLAIGMGGKLLESASAAGVPVWRYPTAGKSRMALGFTFGLLLALFTRLGLLPAQDELVAGAISAMKAQQNSLLATVPAANNPAKRYAGQLVGRWTTIYSSGVLAPVAWRWKCQINEMAKAPANVEYLPEADHNTLAGVINPSQDLLMPHTMTLFLRGPSEHRRNALRANFTRQTYMLEGLNSDVVQAQGDTVLAQIWTAIHFGDYMAYYLAIAYAIDPGADEALVSLEATLAALK